MYPVSAPRTGDWTLSMLDYRHKKAALSDLILHLWCEGQTQISAPTEGYQCSL